jgi:hypothetical protein
MPGGLLGVLFALIIAGLMLWVVSQLPIDAAIAKLIRVVVIVFAVLYVLSVLFGYPARLSIPFRP